MGACLPRLGVRRENTVENSGTSESDKKEKRARHRHRMGQSFPKNRPLPPSEIRRLQRCVSFQEREILDWYQEFCQSIHHSSKRGSFCLTREEFIERYNSVFPGQCAEFAGHIFRTFDRNRDNKVDFEEFLIGMSSSGSDDMDKLLAWAFRLYDVGQKGYITVENMTEIIRAVFMMIGRVVWSHRDGLITPASMAEELFSQMDLNGDRRVTWREFHQGVLRNPTALQILQCSPPADPSPDLADEEEEPVVFT